MPSLTLRGFGWHPDLADHRDYSPSQEAVAVLLRKLKLRTRKAIDLPSSVDWREYCGPIEDQGEFATSTAHACVGLVQHFERRASGRLLRLSRLFADRSARRLAVETNDRGISLRTMLKAITQCGVPPESHWPYDEFHRHCAPDPFVYTFQRLFRAVRYVRLDPAGVPPDQILNTLRSFLAAGFTFGFGFPVCTSVNDESDIPFPSAVDDVLGGQAVSAVGYDDKRRIRSDKGALLVRNSWGTQWGEGGFGWLPYSYVTRRLAVDFWTLLKPTWLRSNEFELPH